MHYNYSYVNDMVVFLAFIFYVKEWTANEEGCKT